MGYIKATFFIIALLATVTAIAKINDILKNKVIYDVAYDCEIDIKSNDMQTNKPKLREHESMTFKFDSSKSNISVDSIIVDNVDYHLWITYDDFGKSYTFATEDADSFIDYSISSDNTVSVLMYNKDDFYGVGSGTCTVRKINLVE